MYDKNEIAVLKHHYKYWTQAIGISISYTDV
jgi:hypothetical protein